MGFPQFGLYRITALPKMTLSHVTPSVRTEPRQPLPLDNAGALFDLAQYFCGVADSLDETKAAFWGAGDAHG